MQRDLLLSAVDYMWKMEQRLVARLVAVHDDLELVLKSELMGRLAHLETTVEQMLDVLEERSRS
jgi:hypothetical protein